ncbi:MAG: hypothetical protein HC890_03990 [Chloroflexaceae bacterium]|nr:hypothetical protein [Chloroflexaceae bacterium]
MTLTNNSLTLTSAPAKTASDQPTPPQGNCPAHIQLPHWEEWLASGVDTDLIALNVRSLSGTLPYDYLLYSDGIPRRNDGRLTEGFLKRYACLEAGGWWCGTLNPLNSNQPSLWGCFKPDQPHLDPAKGKAVKYEHPPKEPTQAFFCGFLGQFGSGLPAVIRFPCPTLKLWL